MGIGEPTQRKSVQEKDGQGQNSGTCQSLKGEVSKKSTHIKPRRNNQRSRKEAGERDVRGVKGREKANSVRSTETVREWRGKNWS